MSVTGGNDEKDLGGTTPATPASPQLPPTAPTPQSTGHAAAPTLDPADNAPTETLPPVEDTAPSDDTAASDETAVMDGMAVEDEIDPADTAVMPPMVPRRADSATASAESPVTPASGEPVARASERNWPGYVAFATGALALSVIAIVLGHLGLSAAKRGTASNRSFALAGTILGYVGLVATAVGLWFALGDHPSAADIDIQAQQDVSAVGAAAATSAAESAGLPDVEQTDDGYIVAGETISAQLTTGRTLTLTGEDAIDWCLDIVYEGGEESAYSYGATTGMSPGPC